MACDATVTGRDTFCHDCGFHLTATSGFMCPLCGCQVETETGFCRHCGTLYSGREIELYLCPRCLLVNAYGERCSCGFFAEADTAHPAHGT